VDAVVVTADRAQLSKGQEVVLSVEGFNASDASLGDMAGQVQFTSTTRPVVVDGRTSLTRLVYELTGEFAVTDILGSYRVVAAPVEVEVFDTSALGTALSGNGQVGAVFRTEALVDWPLSYQWLRDGSPIAGATDASYTIKLADVGASIALATSYTLNGEEATQVTPAIPIPRLESSLAAVLDASAVPEGTAGKVSVTVSAPGLATVGGEVTVELAGTTLRAAVEAGKAVVSLPIIDPGVYLVQVRYSGTDQVAAAHAITGLFTVQATTTPPEVPKAENIYVLKVKLAQSQLVLQKGKEFTIPAGVYFSAGYASYWDALVWKSSNKKVATVNQNGQIVARKAGTVTITATSKQADAKGKKVSAKVKMKVVAKKPKTKVLKVWASVPKSLKLGQVVYITGKYSSTKAASVKVSYSSAKYQVAVVDRAGRLVAKSKGVDTITVKADKKVKKYKITVK
jgi:hypothetical protein